MSLTAVVAQLQFGPSAQHFCISAMIVHGAFMCNESVITIFPFGPVLPSYFHFKASLAHMFSGVESFFTFLKFTSAVQSNRCEILTVLMYFLLRSCICFIVDY